MLATVSRWSYSATAVWRLELKAPIREPSGMLDLAVLYLLPDGIRSDFGAAQLSMAGSFSFYHWG